MPQQRPKPPYRRGKEARVGSGLGLVLQDLDNLPDFGDPGERAVPNATSALPWGTVHFLTLCWAPGVLTNQFQHGPAYLENIYHVLGQASCSMTFTPN